MRNGNGTNGNGGGSLTRPQQWTILGLLAAVVLGGGTLLGSQIVGAIDRNTEVVGGLLVEMKVQSERAANKHAEYARERDRAVDTIRDDIKRVRELVEKPK